jgi:hypothetical protein
MMGDRLTILDFKTIKVCLQAHIENMATGKRINMVKRGGSYVVPAELLVKEVAGFTRQAC